MKQVSWTNLAFTLLKLHLRLLSSRRQQPSVDTSALAWCELFHQLGKKKIAPAFEDDYTANHCTIIKGWHYQSCIRTCVFHYRIIQNNLSGCEILADFGWRNFTPNRSLAFWSVTCRILSMSNVVDMDKRSLSIYLTEMSCIKCVIFWNEMIINKKIWFIGGGFLLWLHSCPADSLVHRWLHQCPHHVRITQEALQTPSITSYYSLHL